MDLIKAAILALAISILPFKALAEEAMTLRMGADLTHFKNKSSIYSFGWETFDDAGLGYKLEAGAWTDTMPDHHGSPFGSVLIGKRFGDYSGWNATGLAGLAILGYTDAALGGLFEFTEEAIVGYGRWGCGYKHISNAGTSPPNQGRDYVSLTLALPF